ncbi:MAG TPA: DUF502 domain-containing protein [Thermodesulfovibrionales bacterium]|nr:DUF502 domain-containing protein [Thermodesulfovibrionales bacterium]
MTPFRTILKRKFLAGLVVLVPLILTVKVIIWFFRFVDDQLGFMFDRMLDGHVWGLGFLSAVAIVFLVGIVSTNVIGKRMIGGIEMLLLKIPVFKGIYTGLKQLANAFSPDNTGSFKKFVIVEYPRSGCFAFGFLTKECTIKAEETGKESCVRAVYIPTNNLYLGEVILFKGEDVFYTDIPIEEGIKIILSGGIATPPRIVEAKE